VFAHTFMDIGLAVHNTGALSTGLVREALELVPFGKLLFSTDAYGLAELYLLGTTLFRHAFGTVVEELVTAGEMAEDDAAGLAALVARDNAARVYEL
jgi:predicted TIM-barrel fold metal-dependent hydrolase